MITILFTLITILLPACFASRPNPPLRRHTGLEEGDGWGGDLSKMAAFFHEVTPLPALFAVLHGRSPPPPDSQLKVVPWPVILLWTLQRARGNVGLMVTGGIAPNNAGRVAPLAAMMTSPADAR